MKFITTLAATMTAGFAISAPVTLSKRVDPNTQSCTSKDAGQFFLVYTVLIGEPYVGGNGCGFVYSTIYAAIPRLAHWHCEDDGNGDTKLKFDAPPDEGGTVNDALHTAYPMVNGFNCPSH
ncbi:hypothetical protein LTR36_006273 [Oleoguttula mirabilis]|uniref:Uncharacterized protein n=1 Tax=Oleoguttula mirabilis TaxID=1507867 RepID=A0AAV9JC46_9PEZI|nr:hypothetical protein LTR36_006273 [Oleoguttula mirabilis]